MSEASPFSHTSTVRIQFACPAHATLAQRAIEVEPELQPRKAQRTLSTDGPTLVGEFAATEARVLRVQLSSFFDAAGVLIRVLQQFGGETDVQRVVPPPADQEVSAQH